MISSLRLRADLYLCTKDIFHVGAFITRRKIPFKILDVSQYVDSKVKIVCFSVVSSGKCEIIAHP